MIFANRDEAGRLLADRLAGERLDRPIILALPRGGVPVAAPVAERLGAPLDVLFVRKIGAPGHAEFAIGAVVDGNPPQTVLNRAVIERFGIDLRYVDAVRDRELAEIQRRRELYRRGAPPLDVQGRTVVVVDDGVATGSTAEAAMLGLRQRGAARTLLAVPVIARDTAARFRHDGLEVVAVTEPVNFYAVGQYYADFRQVEDEEVIDQLAAHQQKGRGA